MSQRNRYGTPYGQAFDAASSELGDRLLAELCALGALKCRDCSLWPDEHRGRKR